MGVADFAIAGQEAAQAVADKAPDAREKVQKFLTWDELKHEKFANVVGIVAKVGLAYTWGLAGAAIIGGVSGGSGGGSSGGEVSTSDAVDYGLGNASGGPQVSTQEAVDAGLIPDGSGGFTIPQWLQDAGKQVLISGSKLFLDPNKAGSGNNPNPFASSALPQENRGNGLTNFIYGGSDSIGGDASSGSGSSLPQRLIGVALIAVLTFVVLNVAYRFFRR